MYCFLKTDPFRLREQLRFRGSTVKKRQKIPFTFADVEGQKTNPIATGHIGQADLKVKLNTQILLCSQKVTTWLLKI